MQFQRKIHPIFHRHSEIALKNILYVVQYMNQPTDNVLPINNWVIVCTVGDLTYFVFKNIFDEKYVYYVYGNVGCQVFKWGIQKIKEIFGPKKIYLLLNNIMLEAHFLFFTFKKFLKPSNSWPLKTMSIHNIQ